MVACTRCGWIQVATFGDHLLVVDECNLCPVHTPEWFNLQEMLTATLEQQTTEDPDVDDLAGPNAPSHG